MQTETPTMSPDASASLDRARAMLINRVRILDPDRISDDSLSVIVADRVRLIDETTGNVVQLDADRAEEIGRALLAGAVKLRVDARDAAARQARDDARFLTA